MRFPFINNLPGLGGVYNTVNFHLYHYAGNNPVKYVDPDGKEQKPPVYAAFGNVVNMDFGFDYSRLANTNFKNGHYALGALNIAASASEAVYDGLAVYGGAKVVSAVATAIASFFGAGSATVAPQAAEQLKPYAVGGGHHPAAQSAFIGNALYNAESALAVPNALLNKMGVSHNAISGIQHSLYSAFAKTGQVLSWDSMAKIETQALTKVGVDPVTAKTWVNTSIQALKDSGIVNPTRIPWGD